MEVRAPWPRNCSPFATLPDEQRRDAEADLLTFFRLAATTPSDDEERWAYDELAAAHRTAIAGMDDLAPTLFEAMAWAAAQPQPEPAMA